MSIKFRKVRPNDTFENQQHTDVAEVMETDEITVKNQWGGKRNKRTDP